MENQNVQKFNIGDKVLYNSKFYKVIQIRDNGNLKLQSIRGKTNEVIFSVPTKLVRKGDELNGIQ